MGTFKSHITVGAKYHKWVNNHDDCTIHKSQTCVHCGITRQWLGSSWQLWEYLRKGGDSTFVRPECKKTKIKSQASVGHFN